MQLMFVSAPIHCVLQHTEEEYGPYDEGEGRHRGGPFTIRVSPTMRIEELRKVIYVSVSAAPPGIPPSRADLTATRPVDHSRMLCSDNTQ